MNIQNQKLINKLANFKNLYLLNPVMVGGFQFIPVDWSRGVLLDPEIAELLAKEFTRMIDFDQIDTIAGIDLQGVPLAMAISLEINKPMVIVREKPKRPGRSPVIGDINYIRSGTRVLLVDDLMAYGGTKEERTKMLEERGAKVTDIAVFIQTDSTPPTNPSAEAAEKYNFDAEKFLEQRKIRLHKLISHSELGQLQADAGTISQELADIIKENANGPYWENPKNLSRVLDLMRRNNIPIKDHVIEHAKKCGLTQ